MNKQRAEEIVQTPEINFASAEFALPLNVVNRIHPATYRSGGLLLNEMKACHL